MTYSALLEFLSDSGKNYTPHTLKTKRKARVVYEPSELLRKLQIEAVRRVFSEYRISPCSTAYEPNCSILNNAKPHQKSQYLVKFDIKDFFGSIKYVHFEKLLYQKYDNQDIKMLWKICSHNNSLPVGAHSSSFISNRIMYDFDSQIAKKFPKLIYTRYADDMVFSSDKPLPYGLENEIRTLLFELSFELNNKKTRIYNEKTPKRVTGVTVTPDNRLTVGKNYKLAIKKQLYNYIIKNKGSKRKIVGRLNYIKFIEPEYYKKLVVKYDLHSNILAGQGGRVPAYTREAYYSQKSNINDNRRDKGYFGDNHNKAKGKINPSFIILAIAILAIIISSIIGYAATKKREASQGAVITVEQLNVPNIFNELTVDPNIYY